MKPYQLAIFDLDGTILNTLTDLASSVNYALKTAGFPARSLEEIRSFLGNGMAYLIEHSVPANTPPSETKEALRCFKQYYNLHCTETTQPYPGIPNLLKNLQEHEIRTAVLSNKEDGAVRKLCRQYFPGLFDAVCGERETVRRKPAPDGIALLLQEMNLPSDSAVYIGDSEVDIQTAKNAGLKMFAVDWGFRSRSFLQEAGADIIFSSVKELENQLLAKDPSH